MTDFTIFTPTYNRAKTLPRVYNSLINQTDKGFVWLVIDDGSNDNTKVKVENWQKENKLLIEYYYKENGGKHTAMSMAYQNVKTKYLIAIDSDDELTPDALETFRNEWRIIENNGLENQFAEVSALTHSQDGKLIGDFIFPEGVQNIDSSWHEMVLKFKNNNEHVVCWNLNKLKECVQIPANVWLSDKVDFPVYLGEGFLWARIGRKYKTRYLNKGLRIYHFDGGESLMRISNKTKGHYNNIVSQKYFLDENLEYFFWNPRYFFNLLLKFIVSGIELKKSPIQLIKTMESGEFKVAYILLFPCGFMAYIYFKFIKRRFWF